MFTPHHVSMKRIWKPTKYERILLKNVELILEYSARQWTGTTKSNT